MRLYIDGCGVGAACDAGRRVASASVGRCTDPVHLRRRDLSSCLLRRRKGHAWLMHVVGSPRASKGSRHRRPHEIHIYRSVQYCLIPTPSINDTLLTFKTGFCHRFNQVVACHRGQNWLAGRRCGWPVAPPCTVTTMHGAAHPSAGPTAPQPPAITPDVNLPAQAHSSCTRRVTQRWDPRKQHPPSCQQLETCRLVSVHS
jgi:hypothetical protein